MKKIGPLLLLLLLLILFCVWKHPSKDKLIDFEVTHTQTENLLSGHLGSGRQKNQLIKSLSRTGIGMPESNIKIDEDLIDHGSIALAEKVVALVSIEYSDAKITYKDNLFTVRGKAHNQNAIDKVDEFLSQANLPAKNMSTLDEAYVAEQTRLAKLAAEKKAKEEAARIAEEKRKAEKAARLAEEKRKAEEAARIAEEKRKAEEAARLAAEKKAKEEAARIAEEKRKAEEAARIAEEKRKAEEAARLAAEKKAKEEAARIAEEKAMQMKREAQQNIIRLLQNEIIEFDVSRASLTNRGAATVDKLVLILQQYPDVKIEIGGHTDSDGGARFNQRLSQKRVDTVKRELVKQGIESDRIIAKGYGESRPLVPNTTRANKQRNRRVEVIVIGD